MLSDTRFVVVMMLLALGAQSTALAQQGPAPLRRVSNVAAGRLVHSLIPQSKQWCVDKGKTARKLTDQNRQSAAAPGASGCDYVIDLNRVLGDPRDQPAATGYRIESLVICWGQFGSALPVREGIDPTDPSVKPETYVARYEVLCRVADMPQGAWLPVHRCNVQPYDEQAKPVGLVCGPLDLFAWSPRV